MIIGEIVAEFFVEVLFKTIIGGFLRLIGASIKWLWHLGKRPFSTLFTASGTGLLGAGVLLIVAISVYFSWDFW